MSSAIDPEEYTDELGRTRSHELGSLTRLEVRRYARAVEDDNPLFHDLDYARDRGYADLVVPPNYLPAIIDYTEGEPAATLREDGLDPSCFPIDLPRRAVLMGGGQTLQFERYITANQSVRAEEQLTNLYQKESASLGVLTFLVRNMTFFIEGSEPVLDCEETIIVGDRP